MRLILALALFFSMSSITVDAQSSMSFSPGIDLEGTVEFDDYEVYQIDIFNELADTLNITWKFLESTLPEDWTITLCDNAVCYGYIPLSGMMTPITDDAAFIKLDVNPHTTAGEGVVSFLIFETEDQSNSYEIRFHISALPVSNENIPDVAIEVYPNPASDFLVIDNSENKKSNISITNTFGHTIYNSLLLPNEKHKVITNDFADGIYYLSLERDQNVISTKQILITR